MDGFIEAIKNSIYINLIYEKRYLFLIEGFGLTVYMTVATFLLATVIGALFCRIRLGKYQWAKKVVELLSTLFIRLPTLVLLLVFVYLIFSNVEAETVVLAIIAFSMKAGSYISDIIYSAYKAVNQGEIEAGRTLGMSRMKVFRYITFPQIVSYALPTYRNQLIITMQETSLVGFFAINDLTRASQVITSRTMDPYIAMVITCVVYLLIGFVSNLIFKVFDRNKHLKEGHDYRVDETI
jgi:His/Glu/Gln/Arg/opine family amino acid ABC transporter permease subunit